MAKSVGFIGGISGKLGNVVFGGTSKNGEAVMRKYNPTPTNPKTARQTLSREIFATAVATLRPVLRVIRIGWQNVDPKRQFQNAVAIAIPRGNDVVTVSGSHVSGVNMTNLAACFSKDELGSLTCGTPDFDVAGHVSVDVSVPDSMTRDAGGNEVKVGLVAFVINKDTQQMAMTQIVAQNSPQTVSIEVPAEWSGLTGHVYVFAKQLPEAKNGILTTLTPWRFPSKCSATTWAGQGDIN